MLMFDDKETLAAVRQHRLLLAGAGALVPTVTFGHGVTLTRTAQGRIKIVFAENPGTFVGIGSRTFRDPTQSNVKGYTVTGGAYPLTAGAFDFEFDMWDASENAVDLPATSFLDLSLCFSELSKP